jgi:hypothetical protein
VPLCTAQLRNKIGVPSLYGLQRAMHKGLSSADQSKIGSTKGGHCPPFKSLFEEVQ